MSGMNVGASVGLNIAKQELKKNVAKDCLSESLQNVFSPGQVPEKCINGLNALETLDKMEGLF